MDPLVFRTAANGGAVVATVGKALMSLGYFTTPHTDGWGGRAEVGSGAMRVLIGGFARRMIVEYRVAQGDVPNATQVIITPAMTGIAGGVVGLNKAKGEMRNIHQAVGSALHQAGLLVDTGQVAGT